MPAKSALTETHFLAVLDKVLGKVLPDLNLRTAVQEEVAREIRLIGALASFKKFTEKESVPDASTKTIAGLRDELTARFGGDAEVEIKAGEKDNDDLAVEITLPDRTVSSQIRVSPGGADAGDDAAAPFVPFPVALPGDPGLVWALARRENFGPDEAARALASIEQEFWASKAGQQRLRKGGDRTFAEFIAAVPSAALLESGLKRHYKEPETLHALQLLDRNAPVKPSRAPKKPALEPARSANDLDHLFDSPVPAVKRNHEVDTDLGAEVEEDDE